MDKPAFDASNQTQIKPINVFSSQIKPNQITKQNFSNQTQTKSLKMCDLSVKSNQTSWQHNKTKVKSNQIKPNKPASERCGSM